MIADKIVDHKNKKVLFTFDQDSLADLVTKTQKTLKRITGRWKNQPFVGDLDFIERMQRNENFLLAYVGNFNNSEVTFNGISNRINRFGYNHDLVGYSFELTIKELEHRRCSRFAYVANESLKRNWEQYSGLFVSEDLINAPRNDFQNFLKHSLSKYLNQ